MSTPILCTVKVAETSDLLTAKAWLMSKYGNRIGNRALTMFERLSPATCITACMSPGQKATLQSSLIVSETCSRPSSPGRAQLLSSEGLFMAAAGPMSRPPVAWNAPGGLGPRRSLRNEAWITELPGRRA
jgi:hypothetical protein